MCRIPFASFVAAFCAFVLASCSHDFGDVSLAGAPKVVNVSAYDPKEKQRAGHSFSQHDVSALRRNGAQGLIARCGKGRELDGKCADFLSAANREGMLLGTYYFMLKGVDPVWQADQYIARLRRIAASRGLSDREILLVGDFDNRSTPSEMIAFINRVEKLTGVLPVVYLENSTQLRRNLRHATPAQKQRLRQCPYWLALYSHTAFHTPRHLMEAYDVWPRWAMWQYGGVEWDRRRARSVSKHYNHAGWHAPQYFGSMDRPLEHNAFNGSQAELRRFWSRHSWRVK